MHPDYFLLPVALILLIVTAISMEKRGDKEEGEKKNSKKEKKTSTTNSWMHTFGCWTAIIVAIWLLAWWGFHYVYNNNYISTWLRPNEFGDMFGALTCLFSGIAIAGVIAMLRQQHEEMKETRKEFSEQTEQFEKQTTLLQQQVNDAKQTAFIQQEQTAKSQLTDEIYRRLTFLKQLEKDICYIEYGQKGVEKIVYGIEAVKNSHKKIFKIFDLINEGCNQFSHNDINNCYGDAFEVWMRFFFTLIKDITDSVKETEEQRYFIRIVINSISAQSKAIIYLIAPTLESPSVNKTLNMLLTREYINPRLFPQQIPNNDTITKFRNAIKNRHHQIPDIY